MYKKFNETQKKRNKMSLFKCITLIILITYHCVDQENIFKLFAEKKIECMLENI